MEHHVDCFIEFNPLVKECRVCDALRACEQRVTERWESLRGWGESYAYKTGSDNGFDVGFVAGLDAAVEALEKYRPNYFASIRQAGPARVFLGRDEAQAAIRALKEKP